MPTPELTGRFAAGSIDELLGGASDRRPMVPADSKSGAAFEWVTIAGERFVLKYQDVRHDWLMRATGDLGRRYVALWESGLLDAVPAVIDHATVGCAFDGRVGAILLRDVSAALLPPGDGPLPLDVHVRLLDHMAALHARFWDWRDVVGLTPLANRYLAFAPVVAKTEAELGSDAVVPRVMAEGWERFAAVAPRAAEVVLALLDDPSPLVGAIESFPHTFVHGDWKAANLGCHPDGRTILLDWGEAPGEASPIADLSWYLALNAARLPQSKAETITTYRAALERHGVDTGGWWEPALGLELLGTTVQFGWEKALGGRGPELAWWEEQACSGAAWL